jgi:hypothetical protein
MPCSGVNIERHSWYLKLLRQTQMPERDSEPSTLINCGRGRGTFAWLRTLRDLVTK